MLEFIKQRDPLNIVKIARKVFENTSEGVMITDARGRIISVNPAFEIVTGYNAEEVMGNNPNILQSGVHDEAFYQTMWKQIYDTGLWKGEIWNKRKNDELYPEWLTISAIKDDSGNVTNYVGVFIRTQLWGFTFKTSILQTKRDTQK